MTIVTNAPVQVAQPDVSVAGHWKIVARPWGQPPLEVSTFRGVPIGIGDFSFSDPFGPQSMDLVVPTVTLFEQLGAGELSWIAKDVDVDVIWDAALPAGMQVVPTVTGDTRTPQWRWEGQMSSFGRSSDGLTIQLKGGLLQLDRWLAKPEYPGRPLPYEWAIARQFRDKPALRLQPLRVVWPSWWTRTYVPPVGVPSYLVPAGVSKGKNWSGLLTRSTGSWDPTLTSYIQSLLTSMYDERGRWTLDLDAHRQPVMFHRPTITAVVPSVVVVDPVQPGVKVDITEDWEQSITTVYGQGTSLSGVAFSGMQISADGSQTTYRPLAYQRQAYPETFDNAWLDRAMLPREVMLQMQPGLSADDAAIVASAHQQRFAEPGFTGTVTLSSDPRMADGTVVPRHLVRAGMTLLLAGVAGRRPGLLVHITDSSHQVASGTVQLTVDSKYRDALTAEEVRLRGRDALSVTRMLVAGQYQPPVSDQMMPWNYAEGSGIIPSNPAFDATALFGAMPNSVLFPWDTWTKAHPPKEARWKSSYLHLGPSQNNANANWIVQKTATGTAYGVPIKMSQAGSIRLLQVAAFDRDGNVLKVPFHISFYYVGGVNVDSMPAIPVNQVGLFPPYQAGQHYPFVRDGFEAYNIDGTKADPNVPQPTQSVGLIRAYGTYYEKAGYWPGSYADGDAATGLLVDESTWSFDVTGTADAYWDPYRAERNLTNPMAGKIYAMIYCDAQGAQDVYFLGRMFRNEPGTGGSS